MSILTAIDGKQTRSKTVEIAKQLADTLDEELVALHVMPQAEFDAIRNEAVDWTIYPVGEEMFIPPPLREKLNYEPTDAPFNIEDAETQAAAVAMKIVKSTLQDDENVDYQGGVGDPAEEILNEAKRRQPRYLVIGGRKRSPVGKAVFGSITQSVLLNAESAVISVPEETADRSPEGPVVAAIDRSERGPNVIKAAADLTDELGVDLHVVHVTTSSKGDDRGASEASRVISDAAGSLDRSYQAVTRVGSPGEEIVNYATESGASYIVTSGRKRSPVGKVLFGSVTQAVLLRSDCPVLSVME